MTDRIYLGIAGLVAVLILADVFANDSAASVFLIRKLFHLVDYLEFWHQDWQTSVEIRVASGC